jgi:NTP pyrophosphatase (non-canonical NTP hydrolase)
MQLEEYQRRASETAIYHKNAKTMMGRLCYVALGLTGEAGEFANKIKKLIRDNKGHLIDTETEPLARELGDTLWYVSQAAAEIGWSLESIAKLNLDTLADRAARGKIGGKGDER